MTARNQQLTRDVANPKRANSGSVTIAAQEKKADYGQISIAFDVSTSAQLSGNIFFMIQKPAKNRPGAVTPIYKSECKKLINGKISWNTVFSDTDTLADGNPDNDLQFQFFKFNSNGNH